MVGSDGLVRGGDGLDRCWWCGRLADYQAYHDREWGRPQGQDQALFEKIVLEGFQAGLSWLTILRKRDNFRRAFADFHMETVAGFGAGDVARLAQDRGLIRHRGKIEAAVNNARKALDLAEEAGSLAAYIWRYEPDPANRPEPVTLSWVQANTQCPEATALSKDLRRRGWRFVGPTTLYAFFQSEGLVNDHLSGCHVRAEVEYARTAFTRPT